MSVRVCVRMEEFRWGGGWVGKVHDNKFNRLITRPQLNFVCPFRTNLYNSWFHSLKTLEIQLKITTLTESHSRIFFINTICNSNEETVNKLRESRSELDYYGLIDLKNTEHQRKRVTTLRSLTAPY